MNRLRTVLAQDPCPVSVLPGCDYRVIDQDDVTRGWIICEPEIYEVHRQGDGQTRYLGTANSLTSAMHLIDPEAEVVP